MRIALWLAAPVVAAGTVMFPPFLIAYFLLLQKESNQQ